MLVFCIFAVWALMLFFLADMKLTAVVLIVSYIILQLIKYPLLDILSLGGYNSLYDKYCIYDELSKEEHRFIGEHFNECLDEMFRNREYALCRKMKKAERQSDYYMMYYLILDWMYPDEEE